jgi:uncharacterized membrane protein YeaQ/YmgE (transglycosylase-associated protein family)
LDLSVTSSSALSAPSSPVGSYHWLVFVIVGGVIAAIINAVIGAVILLLVIGLFKKN